jgi:hypothetical protein
VAPGQCSPFATKHNGLQVDSILINQAKFGEALRQGRPSNFDLRVAPVAAFGPVADAYRRLWQLTPLSCARSLRP